MKIDSATYSLASARFASNREDIRESLRIRPGPGAAPVATVPLTAPAPAPDARADAAASDPLAEAAEAAASDPYLWLVISMVEMLTGRPLRILPRHHDDAGRRPAAGTSAAPAAAGTAPPASAGFGIEYDYHALREEVETTRVAATGTVRTADGHDIGFTLELAMDRRFREETAFSLRAGEPARKDPLVLNFAGAAARLLDRRFAFDLDADGTAEKLPMLAGGSGYLAFDRNGNGRVDDGSELFGPASNAGFAELARLDEDGNGWIDEGDAAFESLLLWSPAEGSVAPLARHGVGALALGHVASPFALRGEGNADLGAVVRSGLYLAEDGRAGSLQEIDLTV